MPLPIPAPPAAAPAPLEARCPAAVEQRPWSAPAAAADQPAPPAAAAGGGDYRHQLRPTPAGWPTRPAWCVWVEPAAATGPAALWEGRWLRAVQGALGTWRRQLPIEIVSRPEQAQVLIWRRRPPIQNRRASHGRALLQLLEVRRLEGWRLEPRVEVLISPGQAEAAMQATALHELGHAFGLWGHSDRPGDAMAVAPGARPVLELSPRDLATLRWLQAQPGLHPGGAAAAAAAP